MKFNQNLMATSITLMLTANTNASGFYKEKKGSDHDHITKVRLEHWNNSIHNANLSNACVNESGHSLVIVGRLKIRGSDLLPGAEYELTHSKINKLVFIKKLRARLAVAKVNVCLIT